MIKEKKKPITKFGVAGRHPKDAGRTPLWDAEEDEIFNAIEDDKYLKSKNVSYSREGNYYIDDKGKYIPGIIYHSPDGETWNHYILTPNGIEGFDRTDLSLEQYNLYKTLGLNNERFYRNADEAEFYRPNPELILPKNGEPVKIGNSTVTFKERYPHRGKAVSKKSLRDYTNYGSWHVVDPDKGYDFTVNSGILRDGGSRAIDLVGKYPEEWNEYSGGIVRLSGLFPSEDEIKQAELNRNNLNNILKVYGILFEKNGGLMKKYQQGGQLSDTQQQGLQYLALMYVQQTGKDPQLDLEGFMQFVQQLAQQAGVQDIGQLLDMIYQQAQGQAQAAKHGAKLNYLRKLTDKCPEGTELVYFKAGGRVCSLCKEKIDKEACGKKIKKNCGGKKMFQKGEKIVKDQLPARPLSNRNSGKGGRSSLYGNDSYNGGTNELLRSSYNNRDFVAFKDGTSVSRIITNNDNTYLPNANVGDTIYGIGYGGNNYQYFSPTQKWYDNGRIMEIKKGNRDSYNRAKLNYTNKTLFGGIR